MIRNLKPRLQFRSKNNCPAIQLIESHNFEPEQSIDQCIRSLCKQNRFRDALHAFELTQRNINFGLNLGTYAHLIIACSSLRSLEHGRKVHNHMMRSQRQPDMILQNHIVSMYGKCGSMKDAQKVFDIMPDRNVVSWTSLIAGYSQNGQEETALKLYFDMLRSGFVPDQYTFGSILKVCSSVSDATLGKQLHAHILKSESGSHLIAQNALIAMYTKLEHVIDALSVFSRIRAKNLVSWGSIIAALSQFGYELESLRYFKQMLREGIYQPNGFIFGSIFSTCSSLLQPKYGIEIHGICIKFGLGGENFAGCSLSDMYARCGLLGSSMSVFRQIDCPDAASWNAIITAFSYNGDLDQSLSLFSEMRHRESTPNDITIISLIGACKSPSALWHGKQLHSYIIKTALDVEVPVCNTLLIMYTKCSHLLNDAFIMFNEFKSKADLISWNAILTTFMQHNEAEGIFRLFNLMCCSFCKPDSVTLAILLKACAQITSLETGKQVHCYMIKTGLELNSLIANGLIDMYTKCGILSSARNLFDSLENPDVVSWSSMILGLSQCGNGEEALELFKTMRDLGVEPNEVTFVGVLTACSHVGMVEEGLKLYENMETEYGILPTREHHSCMVDLLSRAGQLNEARDFITKVAFDADIVVWKTLLSACRTHKDVDTGKWAAEKIMEIDPYNSAAYVLLSSICFDTGNWEEFARLRSLMRSRGVRKVMGQSRIEVS
ncbi:hypothetical protein Nepgr_030514 [Nepenthes gracilis]|uniref:Pentatricopeptide repeat-containing protein n=1 Tax=Nepenthes gracilis TaxID=150966 RepID=A0AAD3TGT6_NEPGR|nr:hypothetical protein Nepgr_030514 [Nepenthes gracilis]